MSQKGHLFLNLIIRRDLTTDLLHNLIIQIDLSSCPCALLILRALIVFNMKQNAESLAVETCFNRLGMILLLTRGIQFEAKKLSK